MDSPDSWRWIWLLAAVAFAVGEMATPGSFFLLPFAIGAGVAAALAFADVSVAIEWAAFIGLSVATLVAMRPLARRLDRDGTVEGIGSRRLVGRVGQVLDGIGVDGAHDLGLVRVDREEWRAESADGAPIEKGAMVRVTEITGTRLVVAAEPATPPAEPKESTS